MVDRVLTRIQSFAGSRHHIYLRNDLVTDSQFPFKVGQKVQVRIEGQRLVVEEVPEPRSPGRVKQKRAASLGR